MNKEQYLQELRGKLEGNIGPKELDDALAYYNEYFEDAGVDHEAEVDLSYLCFPHRHPHCHRYGGGGR